MEDKYLDVYVKKNKLIYLDKNIRKFEGHKMDKIIVVKKYREIK